MEVVLHYSFHIVNKSHENIRTNKRMYSPDALPVQPKPNIAYSLLDLHCFIFTWMMAEVL